MDTSNLDPVVQAILFALFAGLTGIINSITGPTYDGVLVPELGPSALYPPMSGGGSTFLSTASDFSGFLVVHLVDPAIVLVALALGLLYLARSFLGRETAKAEALLPRLVVSVVLANVSVPVAGAILALAGSVYPMVAGFDGGAWQAWGNLAGVGSFRFSWDNGALAFVVTFILFTLILLLAAAVAIRDALLGVLLVLLPVLTLAGTVPALRPLARRVWLLFGEAAFLPCVIVIPLELAVGSPSGFLLVAYLAISLGSPVLISVAGTSLSGVGFPSAGPTVSGGIQRGLSVASLGATSYGRVLNEAGTTRGSRALSSAARSAGMAPLPISASLAAGDLLGRGASHLVRHIRGARSGRPGLQGPTYRAFPPTPKELP